MNKAQAKKESMNKAHVQLLSFAIQGQQRTNFALDRYMVVLGAVVLMFLLYVVISVTCMCIYTHSSFMFIGDI